MVLRVYNGGLVGRLLINVVNGYTKPDTLTSMVVQYGKRRKAWSSAVNVEKRRTHIAQPHTPKVPLRCTRRTSNGSVRNGTLRYLHEHASRCVCVREKDSRKRKERAKRSCYAVLCYSVLRRNWVALMF